MAAVAHQRGHFRELYDKCRRQLLLRGFGHLQPCRDIEHGDTDSEPGSGNHRAAGAAAVCSGNSATFTVSANEDSILIDSFDYASNAALQGVWSAYSGSTMPTEIVTEGGVPVHGYAL